MIEGAFVFPLLQSEKTHNTCSLKSETSDSCDRSFIEAAENIRNGMTRTFKDNAVTGELFSKMRILKIAVEKNKTPITTAPGATVFVGDVKNAFDEDKKSFEIPSVPAQSVTSEPVQSVPAQSVTSEPAQSVPAAQVPVPSAVTSVPAQSATQSNVPNAPAEQVPSSAPNSS